jgi:hypothetical protein
LEKTLKANGYTKGNDAALKDLQKRIDAAAADGVITDAAERELTTTSAHSAMTCCTTTDERLPMTKLRMLIDTPNASWKTYMMTEPPLRQS